jgi:hypothetical protein
MRMKILLGHVIDHYHGIKRKGGHHHMSKTAGTHTNEDYQQDYKYSIFIRI